MNQFTQSLVDEPAPASSAEDVFEIPQGGTCRGVNKAIVNYLQAMVRMKNGTKIMDCPCGGGQVMSVLENYWPDADVYGADITRPPNLLGSQRFECVDANRPFRVFPDVEFDIITSISGVCEFDNTLQFFEHCRDHLAPDGVFIVSNDNFVSLRDRISQFFFGKYRQYALFSDRNKATWKIIPIQNLVRQLMDAGFEIDEVRYVSFKGKDLLLLPLALIVYAVQSLGMVFHKRMKIPSLWKRRLYPFGSLFYRHYLVICHKS